MKITLCKTSFIKVDKIFNTLKYITQCKLVHNKTNNSKSIATHRPIMNIDSFHDLQTPDDGHEWPTHIALKQHLSKVAASIDNSSLSVIYWKCRIVVIDWKISVIVNLLGMISETTRKLGHVLAFYSQYFHSYISEVRGKSYNFIYILWRRKNNE
jgi:hypothetical protein